jgi:FKBP-type peptidyl-prolyl cis-trans isomerase
MNTYSRQKWISALLALLVLLLIGWGIYAYQAQQDNLGLINLNDQTMDNLSSNNTANLSGAIQPAQPETKESGLVVQDITVGSGETAKAGDTVAVNYIGALPDGKIFDSSYSRNEPFPFTIGAGRVIKGWDEGVAGMRVGGKRRLIIPPHLAYGKEGAGDVIPPNTTLIFEIELVGIQK